MDNNKKEELNSLKTKNFWLNFSMLSVFTAVSLLLEVLCLNLAKNGVFFEFKTLFCIVGVFFDFDSVRFVRLFLR